MILEEIRILVVDDSEEHRDLVTKWLRVAGYDATGVSGGAESIRILRRGGISVLLTDLHMAGMDGLALARKVREVAPETSIILCTADWSPQLLEKARESCVAAVFGKPLNLRRVGRVIAAEVERQKMRKRMEPSFAGWASWTCPVCSTRHVGWSPINLCSGCGYRDRTDEYPTQVA